MGSNSPNFLPSAFDNIFAAIDLREIYHQMKMNAILCRIYNATCVAYEAGQSLLYTPTPYSDNNQTLFLAAANRDPRMGKLYVQYFEFWFKAMGPSLALHYTDIGITSKWGYWGSLNDIRNTSSPKRDALQSILQSSWNSTTFNKQVTRTQVMSPHRTTTTTTTTNYVVPSPSILPLASKLNWLGTNLAGLSYWTTAAPLKNMLKVSIINYSTIPFGNGIWTVFPFEEWEAVSDVILDLDQNGYAKYVSVLSFEI